MDIRQWPFWGNYLSKLGWKVETISGRKIFIRPVPLFPFSVIKIQRPNNPFPFTQVDKLAKKYRALFTLVEPNILNYKEQDFQKAGYKPSMMIMAHTSTIIVNLTQEEKQLFASFSENARRNIKKALKNQLTVKVFFLKNDAGDFHFNQFLKLFKNLSKLKKFYIPGREENIKKMQAFKNNSLLLFAYSKPNEDPIAAVWMGFYRDTAVYINTGIVNEGYQKLANYLLVWEAFKEAKKLGMKFFDFEGILDPRFPKEHPKWANFTEFKKRFHGQEISYPPPWIKIYSPVFHFFYLCSRLIDRLS